MNTLRRRLVLRGPTLFLLAVTVAMATGAYVVAGDDIAATEQRLLDERTELLEGPLQGLGTQYGSRVVAAAAVAEATDGAGFREFVTDNEGDDATGLEWSLFRLVGDEPRLIESVGPPPSLLDNLSVEVRTLLARTTETPEYVVLGMFGDQGLDRSIALAAAQPTLTGTYLAYAEIPLISAVTPEPAASDAENPAEEQADNDGDLGGGFEDLALAMYLGSEDEANLIFAFGGEAPFRGRTGRTVIDVGAQQIVLVTKATKPLAEGVTRALPWVLLGAILLVGLVLAALVEVSLRRRAARARYEAELRQSQRLEAVGRLAGGVAHDFNNLLTAILSYGDLIADELGAEHPASTQVEEIQAAARRGADLVRQLLMFSRREPAHRETLNLAEVVRGVTSLLARLVTDRVTIDTRFDPDAAPIDADRGQIEQVLVNLVVNAHDAIEKTGTITIEIEGVTLDRSYARRNPDARIGRHTRLRVTDTGTGMDPSVRARAFEPFFTTKDPGRGTGLGLSTVYGIVQRNGGHVSIDSVQGAGTAISVYLPAAKSQVEALHGESSANREARAEPEPIEQ